MCVCVCVARLSRTAGLKLQRDQNCRDVMCHVTAPRRRFHVSFSTCILLHMYDYMSWRKASKLITRTFKPPRRAMKQPSVPMMKNESNMERLCVRFDLAMRRLNDSSKHGHGRFCTPSIMSVGIPRPWAHTCSGPHLDLPVYRVSVLLFH